ncbi:hypothetical protein KIN20_033269 [Parelaphostrongylus tenuis]|uniref:Uncharacterized protein n=1 Tax=Parelaphostrongylus tenuis TaxID=148309 RepID=A0AAD5WJ29_PARTN|nr:hypothetical protein KIN20_033269 [Parelaphostrongylus tenuis]
MLTDDFLKREIHDKDAQQAGKVLEDVHDRLIEDHSSATVAPLMSPETPPQDQESTMDMDGFSSIDDRVKSNILLDGQQRGVKQTVISSLASRIPEGSGAVPMLEMTVAGDEADGPPLPVRPAEAEQTVERKRGSVQLAKRLQRRLTIHQEEGPTEGELKSVDEQIEHALEV